MNRIPNHSIADAPEASRSLLAYFPNYAGTELDIPAGVPGVGPARTGQPATASGAGS